MLGCSWARTTARILAGAVVVIGAGAGGAEASLTKQSGSPPLVMPGTLLVEAGDRLDSPPPPGTAPKNARAVADTKMSPRTCSAAAVLVPHIGTRIVTARHCADHRRLAVLDDEHQLTPIEEVDAAGDIDLSVLEMAGPAPWQGLAMRSAATVTVGERLCAWRMRRGDTDLVRERICGRLVRRERRSFGAPLLVMNHPYPAGTSGSALVDRAGRVVGIVVASTGLTGLAEPIDEVLRLPPPKAR
jgi:hypothetical protein